jgi:indolepyruvate ferredoxin oxidoreductase
MQPNYPLIGTQAETEPARQGMMHAMTTVPDTSFTLSDRYNAVDGEVLVTGIQALARVPLDQMRADQRRGWKTAAFVSGYQGSPLGGFDRELLANPKVLAQFGVKHWPGLNEELAATAVAGSQLVSTMKTANVEGVAGYWYGKAPGLERAADAIRHAVFVGCAPRGGVLAMIGDDPACKSSTLPSRSDSLVAALGFPLLDPGTMQDVLDLGRHGVEMSRVSGLWAGLKIVTSIADGSGSANVDVGRLSPVMPVLEHDGKPWNPMLSGFVLAPVSLTQESEVFGPRLELASRYIEDNKINVEVVSSSSAWLTIVASGYTAEVVVSALKVLGLTEREVGELGIRVLKLRALHPFDGAAIRRVARGVGTVLVVEEKRAYIETLVRDALYSSPDRPMVIGKRDSTGAVLVSDGGSLSVDSLIEPLRRVLLANISAERLQPIRKKIALNLAISHDAVRTPYFCSGCPHNTSTVVPEGSYVGVGIGCHGMVSTIGNENRGEFTGITQMGGEGMHWVGMAPFVDTPHIFQNLGDGTFFHSGQLAVQAAISSGVTMTYKILYNSAVAMTGGQDATGQLAVPQVAAKLMAEGAKRIIITTDEPEKYKGVRLADGVSVRHRDDILKAQEDLRNISGVTVLIHDQQCAAEKRRDRKRGLLPTPKTRIVIDHRVCEGCGDCGVQSNCLSLEPFDTEYGRKTNIDQASCNIDQSCLKGDCPAFVTVTPAAGGRSTGITAEVAGMPQLTEPVRIIPMSGMVMRMPGIGGTGVVTVSQMLLAAARVEGITASAVDQTGLSQKAGPVVSTVTFGSPDPGRVHVLLGFDILTSVTPANIEGLDAQWSHVVASSSVIPTGRMIGNVSKAAVDLAPYRQELDARSGSVNHYVNVAKLAVGLLGNAVTGNVLLLGVAFQSGMLPVSAASIERAIELNGAAVDMNKAAFVWGRRWVLDPKGVEKLAAGATTKDVDRSGLNDLGSEDVIELVARRRKDLRDYQNAQYADRYVGVLRRAEAASGSTEAFVTTVAHQLFRVMAYKDEYEVARLLTTGRDRIERSMGGPVESVTWNLHPPTLRALGMGRKLQLGPSTKPVMVALAKLKRLRGTAADPFGRTEMRRTERALIEEYIALVDRLIPMLTARPDDAVRIAGLIDQVRGFESVKERNLAAYRIDLAAQIQSAEMATAEIS